MLYRFLRITGYREACTHSSGTEPNIAGTTADTDTSPDDADGRRTVRLGLVPSPAHCQRIAEDIAESLRDELHAHVDDQVTWDIVIQPDPLSGSNVDVSDLLDEIYRRAEGAGWDYAICLTDLPLRRDARIVVAEASDDRDIAFISLPSLGAFRLRSRVRAMILQLMEQLHRGTSSADASHHKVSADNARPGNSDEAAGDVDITYTAPRIRGQLKLLIGMVYANRPWSLFPNFKTTVATAFATGGYGLIFTTLWKLGDAYGIGRLTTLMIVSMSILIAWIIISHELWESHRKASSQYWTTLYNVTTVLTITAGVVFAYVVIFILLLLAAFVYIPAAMLEATLQHPVIHLQYVNIAWVTSSVATIAEALGAGLEDTKKVRNATFGWRQLHRYEQYKREEDSDEENG